MNFGTKIGIKSCRTYIVFFWRPASNAGSKCENWLISCFCVDNRYHFLKNGVYVLFIIKKKQV